MPNRPPPIASRRSTRLDLLPMQARRRVWESAGWASQTAHVMELPKTRRKGGKNDKSTQRNKANTNAAPIRQTAPQRGASNDKPTQRPNKSNQKASRNQRPKDRAKPCKCNRCRSRRPSNPPKANKCRQRNGQGEHLNRQWETQQESREAPLGTGKCIAGLCVSASHRSCDAQAGFATPQENQAMKIPRSLPHLDPPQRMAARSVFFRARRSDARRLEPKWPTTIWSANV